MSISCWPTRSWFPERRPSPRRGRSSAPPTSPPHITKLISDTPDVLICGVWGGDYVAFYKQALRYGLFEKMKVATTLAFGGQPHAIGKDHPEGVLAGCHANYFFTFPAKGRWPINDSFVERYYKRWNEYPSFELDGAYTALYLLKAAIEKANHLVGGWPDGRRHHRHARRRGDRFAGGVRLHPTRQPPGLQGCRYRDDQERSQVRLPRLGSASRSSRFPSGTSRHRRTGRSPARRTTNRRRRPTG